MKVTFCGHRYFCYDKTDFERMINIIESLINDGADCFYLGGYGEFDKFCARAVKTAKERNKKIKSIIVIPYINHKFDSKLFDESLYPPIERGPQRFAIERRNKWMIDNSDILISYVKLSYGGAYKTYNYAKNKNKKIINFEKNES